MSAGLRALSSGLRCLVVAAALGGCASAPQSVKSLISVQNDKTKAAIANTKELIKATEAVNSLIDQAVAQLDQSMRDVQMEEAIYALTFASSQNLESKTGIDASAAAYVIAEVYLGEQEGLSAAVKEQFAASKSALSELSAEIAASWVNIQELQKRLDSYAQGSPIAALDPEVIAAVSGEIPGSGDKVAELLAKTREVKERLDEAAAHGLKSRGVEQARSTITDLTQLLEAVSKSKNNPK